MFKERKLTLLDLCDAVERVEKHMKTGELVEAVFAQNIKKINDHNEKMTLQVSDMVTKMNQNWKIEDERWHELEDKMEKLDEDHAGFHFRLKEIEGKLDEILRQDGWVIIEREAEQTSKKRRREEHKREEVPTRRSTRATVRPRDYSKETTRRQLRY